MGHRAPRLLVLIAWAHACTPSQVRYETMTLPEPDVRGAEAVLYLVGDAGEANPARDAVLDHLSREIESVVGLGSGARVIVAFLGDNLYDAGLPSAPSDEDLEKLGAQVRALGASPHVRGVFLPGNHDWADGASLEDGRAAVARQREWVSQAAPGHDVQFLPDGGCPGPASENVGGSLHLVFIDTEWLLRRPEQGCGTALQFYERLAEDLRENRDRRIIIMSHHPMVSGGPHGGNVAPFENGPLVYYLVRKSGANVQDLSSGRYSEMVARLQEAIAASGTRPLVHAGGHDHTLQVIGVEAPDGPAYQLVSGAGSKSERSRQVSGTRYATDGFGYMRLDFEADGVGLTVFAMDVDGGPVRAVFACRLSTAGEDGSCPQAPLMDEGS